MEALSKSILGEARAEIEELKQGAQSRASSVRQRAQEAAARERSEILDRAHDEARRLRSQAIATAQLKAKALELDHREKVLERVFHKAAERLADAPQHKDYEAIVVQLVREAVSQLRAETAELRTDKMTQKVLAKGILDQLSKETGAKLTFGETLEVGTGVIAQTPDHRLRLDNTLETRLARLRATTRSEVYQVLIGGQG